MDIPFLTSLVIFLPTAGALLTLLMRSVSSIRCTALATTTLTFVLSIGLFVGYSTARGCIKRLVPGLARRKVLRGD